MAIGRLLSQGERFFEYRFPHSSFSPMLSDFFRGTCPMGESHLTFVAEAFFLAKPSPTRLPLYDEYFPSGRCGLAWKRTRFFFLQWAIASLGPPRSNRNRAYPFDLIPHAFHVQRDLSFSPFLCSYPFVTAALWECTVEHSRTECPRPHVPPGVPRSRRVWVVLNLYDAFPIPCVDVVSLSTWTFCPSEQGSIDALDSFPIFSRTLSSFVVPFNVALELVEEGTTMSPGSSSILFFVPRK